MKNSPFATVKDFFCPVFLVLFVYMTPVSCTGQSRHEVEGCVFTILHRKTGGEGEVF